MVVAEQRMEALEERTRALEARVRAARAAAAPSRPRSRLQRSPSGVAPRPKQRASMASGAGGRTSLGGRVLAWVGGLAVLVGIVFLLAIAVSRGWIGEDERAR